MVSVVAQLAVRVVSSTAAPPAHTWPVPTGTRAPGPPRRTTPAPVARPRTRSPRSGRSWRGSPVTPSHRSWRHVRTGEVGERRPWQRPSVATDTVGARPIRCASRRPFAGVRPATGRQGQVRPGHTCCRPCGEPVFGARLVPGTPTGRAGFRSPLLPAVANLSTVDSHAVADRHKVSRDAAEDALAILFQAVRLP